MKNYKAGQKLMWLINEPACHHKMPCTVTEVYEDYALAMTENGIRLWIDKDTEEEFEEGRC